jgi:RNA polymerase sigma factor (sigma-70 family)
MTTSPGQLWSRFQRLAVLTAEATPDAALLERFVRIRDEDAFAALVSRHGPMVWRICRRVLGDAQAAEDAFQATFLALARRAGAVRRRDAQAAWLHAVARRAAFRAHTAMRRWPAEMPVGQTAEARDPWADPLAEVSVRELLTALDEEVARLPEVQRLPVILCCLEGKTQPEAARQLGWSPGSVQGRLERGRKRLFDRLAKRGLTLSTALAAVAVSRGAAGVPFRLTAHTIRASLIGTAGTLPARVVALAEAAGLGSVPGKYHVALALLLALVVAAVGTELAMQAQSERQPAPDSETQIGEPKGRSIQGPAVSDFHGDPLPAGAAARLGTLRFNHGSGLRSLFYLPDGKTILSEGDGAIRLWDADTGKELRHFATPKRFNDDAVVLILDGKTLVLLSQEATSDTLRFWDVARGKESRVVRLPVRRKLFSVYFRNALTPDGQLCAIHTQERIQVFETSTAKECFRLPLAGDAIKIVLFAGNDRLVTVDKKRVVRVWEARSGRLVREFGHDSPGEFFAVSPDGRRLAVLERRYRPYKIPSEVVLQLHDHDVLHLWDLTKGTHRHSLEARPNCWHVRLQFAPDGKRLFASGYDDEQGEPFALTVWDAESGRRLHEMRRASGRSAVAVSPDGTRLAEGAEGPFALWDLKTGRRLSPTEGRFASSETVLPAPGGDRILTFGYAALHTWDGRTGQLHKSRDLPPYPYADPGRSHFFSAEGRLAASLHLDEGRTELLVWDVATGKRLQTIRPPGGPTYLPSSVQNATRAYAPPHVAGAFSPDASVLVTWHPGKQGVARLWDVRTGKEIRVLRAGKDGGHGRPFFAAGGKTLIIAGQGVVGFDVASGEKLFAWRPVAAQGRFTIRSSAVGSTDEDFNYAWRASAASPDGAVVAGILAGGGAMNERLQDRIVLYEARTGKILRRWNDSGMMTRMGEQLTFSRDGRLLATSDGDVAHLWEVATGKEIQSLRGHRGDIRSLAFSADGRYLATGGIDATVLLWDLASPPAGARGGKALTALWDDLADADPAQAYAAVWRLALAPGQAVPLLRLHLKPATAAQVNEIRKAIMDLDNNAFSVRGKASQRLRSLGLAAAPALRATLENKTSLEMRRRIEQVLGEMRDQPGESLRMLRAMAVLEYAGTPEARRLLGELADGAEGAWLTCTAMAARERRDRLATQVPSNAP